MGVLCKISITPIADLRLPALPASPFLRSPGNGDSVITVLPRYINCMSMNSGLSYRIDREPSDVTQLPSFLIVSGSRQGVHIEVNKQSAIKTMSNVCQPSAICLVVMHSEQSMFRKVFVL